MEHKTKYKLDLKKILSSIDHKSYPAYKSAQGQYDFGTYLLSIDHVQGDPFASPSKIRVILPRNKSGFPDFCTNTRPKRIALEDYLLRLFHDKLSKCNGTVKGSGKSGLFFVSQCSQEVLERSGCYFGQTDIEIRLEAGFPANGRTIQSSGLITMLFEHLPSCIQSVFFYSSLDPNKIKQISDLTEDQEFIRDQLKKRGLCAFVADGSILPRETGVSKKPLRNAVPFYSPESLAVTLPLPHKGNLRGMGIPKGITLIIGGGYHGKSTLLNALETGVYNRIARDGREYVISDSSAVKIRAEDGRNIESVNIQPFIDHLPNKKDTKYFKTADASGSTSQAANVIEAVQADTQLLLIDEDTCATNFMIRDELMQKVVLKEKEPIAPFFEAARPLYHTWNVSTILVAGSFGTYFHIADTIIQMDEYIPIDVTRKVKEILRKDNIKPPLHPGDTKCFSRNADRIILPIKRGTSERSKIRINGMDSFTLDKETVDIRYVEQIVDSEQTAALAYIVKYILEQLADGEKTIHQLVSEVNALIDKQSLSSVTGYPYPVGGLARPRTMEIHAALNRYRRLSVKR